MTAHRPDDIDRDLVQRYRHASSAGPSAPSDAVRAAILAEGRRVAAENAAPAASPTRRWPYALLGTLSAAALATFLILPRFAPAPDRTQPVAESAARREAAPAPAATAPAARAEQALRATAAGVAQDSAAPSANFNAKARGAAPGKAATVLAEVAAGNFENVRALLDQGAAVDAADDDGIRPLLLATTRGRADIVRLLLDRGADPNAADHAGRTPLQEAKRRQLKDIESALIGAGAR